MQDAHLIPLSALQHYDYCPRQCALIHIERLWSENYWTAQGQVLHQRVDQGKPEQRPGTRIERSVEVIHQELGIWGVLDVLEITQDPLSYTPVEYKRGKPKTSNCDKLQLCAQALCLEAMLSTEIPRAALWYWQVRQRHWVELDQELRAQTLSVIDAIKDLFAQQRLPAAQYSKACRACSLQPECQPKALQQDHSAAYLHQLYQPQADQDEKATK